MDIKEFVSTWHGTRVVNKALLIAVVVLAVSNTILVLAALNEKTVVTVVPPTAEGKVKIGSNFASESYIEAWALYMALSLGNSTPNTVRFIRASIEPLLSPLVYNDVMKALSKQVEDIRESNVSLYFEPRRVVREEATKKVFVHGFSVMEAPTGERKRTERTYEFKFEVKNYMPSLTHIDTYPGPPLTKEEIEKQERINASRRKARGEE